MLFFLFFFYIIGFSSIQSISIEVLTYCLLLILFQHKRYHLKYVRLNYSKKKNKKEKKRNEIHYKYGDNVLCITGWHIGACIFYNL